MFPTVLLPFLRMIVFFRSIHFIELHFCPYADLRVAPYGVVSLHQRFTGLRERYKNTALENRYEFSQKEKSLHRLNINDQLKIIKSLSPFQRAQSPHAIARPQTLKGNGYFLI